MTVVGDGMPRDGAAGGFAVLDDEAIRSLGDMLGDDPEAIAELVDAFLLEAPTRLEELHAGIDDVDLELAGRAAHTLKSNALTFGATTLGAVCQELESAAREGRLESVGPLAGQVDAEWARVRPVLEGLRARHGP